MQIDIAGVSLSLDFGKNLKKDIFPEICTFVIIIGLSGVQSGL